MFILVLSFLYKTYKFIILLDTTFLLKLAEKSSVLGLPWQLGIAAPPGDQFMNCPAWLSSPFIPADSGDEITGGLMEVLTEFGQCFVLISAAPTPAAPHISQPSLIC